MTYQDDLCRSLRGNQLLRLRQNGRSCERVLLQESAVYPDRGWDPWEERGVGLLLEDVQVGEVRQDAMTNVRRCRFER